MHPENLLLPQEKTVPVLRNIEDEKESSDDREVGGFGKTFSGSQADIEQQIEAKDNERSCGAVDCGGQSQREEAVADDETGKGSEQYASGHEDCQQKQLSSRPDLDDGHCYR
ncbi:unnamed protein product [Gongylonema pulchrum]|uniref:Uncharacterized protein n=1 Tax=Gongylonema pulchrum TaxID=637853 RepID=A0A183EMW1_9BILA|nr:unnamed protein product [Gongylonema pulchrum]